MDDKENKMRIKQIIIGLTIVTILETISVPALGTNFTTGSQTARKFGVHEIELTGNGNVANPLDTIAVVTFIPPSGADNAKIVHMFYDGGNTWRARLYVSEAGKWSWVSSSDDAVQLNGKNGTFTAVTSSLRGKLRKHRINPRALMTEDGNWFFNMCDTAYTLMDKASAQWQQFIRDNWNHGITSVRCLVIGWGWKDYFEWDWKDYFTHDRYNKFNLANFQRVDTRLQWMLENYPGMYVQLIMLPGTKWGKDESFWANLSSRQRTRLLRFLVARYATYPQIFWLIGNDYSYGKKFPNNNAMANEVGRYLEINDPWQNLVSTGRTRSAAFPFPGASWATYYHLETLDALAANQVADYSSDDVHVFNGEDRYETYKAPANPRYFFRWLGWSWHLSGGSATYGGDYRKIIPYESSGFVGLDSVKYIKPYFASRGIDLSLFQEDDSIAFDLDGRNDDRRPQLARRGTEEYLIYHPNPASYGRNAAVASNTTARLSVDLSAASGMFQVEWFRAYDGVTQNDGTVSGGKLQYFTAPWTGYDVVLWLKKTSAPENIPANNS